MTDITIADDAQELKVEKLDDYLQAAAAIVEELRDFLSGHYAELVHTKHEPNAWGSSLTMLQASQDPGYAARIHNYKNACDQFINIMRGNL